MLSKDEWRTVAERAAAAKYGERHAAKLLFLRFGAGPVGILLAAGGLGLGAWWVYAHVLVPLFSGGGPGLHGFPVGFWVVAVIGMAATIAALRVAVPSAPFLIARSIVAVLFWLGMAAYALAVIAS